MNEIEKKKEALKLKKSRIEHQERLLKLKERKNRTRILIEIGGIALIVLNASLDLITSMKLGFFRVIQGCLLLGAILGLGHFLIQMGALPDPCSSPKGLHTAQEFSQLLSISKCSTVAWSFLRVPFSLINCIGCSLVFGVMLKNFRKLD